MAIGDHTGRMRASVPLERTLGFGYAGLHAPGGEAHKWSCQLSPTGAIGYG